MNAKLVSLGAGVAARGLKALCQGAARGFSRSGPIAPLATSWRKQPRPQQPHLATVAANPLLSFAPLSGLGGLAPPAPPAGAPRRADEDEEPAAAGPTAGKRNMLSQAAMMMAALPMVPMVGACSMTEPLLGPTACWLLESCIPVTDTIALGLPGLAAQVFFLSPVPVMKKIIAEKSTGQMPLLPYSSMAASGYLWIVYGHLNDNAAIWLPNIPAFALGTIFTGIFYKNCVADANWLPGNRNMHVAGVAGSVALVTGIAAMLDTTTAISALGWIGTGFVISMFGGPLAAMKTVIETKDTSSLPFTMTVATFVNCTLWTVYGTCVIEDFFIWFPNSLGLLSSFVQFGLFAKFGFGKKE